MGHCNGGQYCRNAGIDCYQKGFTTYAPHMSYENFMEIVKQAAGKTFQIALGGAGDPNKHPQIEDILKSCRAYRIIPNMTTSGFLITDNEVGLIKQYCGAVAVSWYSRFMDGKESNQETIDAVERLVKSGCTTNIHYVVSKDTINEAITRLEMDSFPKGVNAVIFILYKPVGNGIIEKVLKNTDSRIERFISLATKVKHPYRVGFDTCFTPALLRWGDTVPAVSIDACEAATFSMYIDSQMNCYPCSFGIWDKSISESMNSKALREIWQGDKFMICQRPAHKARGLLWEFVGGKVEPGETKEQALIRECQEELAVTLSVGDIFMDVVHEYPDLTVHLTLFNATIAEGEPQKLEHNDIQWITPSEIPNYEFCPADVEILSKICTITNIIMN